jgi:monothiol glutaredoxin
MNAIGKPFAFVNIFEDQEIREGLKTYSNWPTFPQLYVNGELVGGADIVIEMYHSGELKTVLEGVVE